MIKPVEVIEDNDGTDDNGREIMIDCYFCPTCQRRLYWRRGNCKYCGQELDWSVV